MGAPVDIMAWQDRLAERAVAAGVPGVSVAVLAGDEITTLATGVLNTATGVAVTTDSLFQIGSVTKVWTATVLMRLVEQGRVELDAPVVRVLPAFRVADPAAGERITLRHLLTHTSGIDGDFFHDTGRGDDCLERYVAACAGLAQVHPVGATMSYCNTGYVVLGRIVEVLAGRCWDDALRELLIEPLGLTHSQTLAEEVLRYRAALGHEIGADGVLRPAAIWGMPRSLGPAGTINATAADMLGVARLHLSGGLASDGTRLLTPASVAAMRAPQVEVPNPWGKGDRWGLGWALFDRGGVLGHDGSTIGQKAILRIVPEADVAVAALANADSAGPLLVEITDELLEELTGLPPAPPLTPPSHPVRRSEADLRRWAGVYERTAVRIEAVVRGGALVLRVHENDDLGAGLKDYEVELTPLPDGRFAGRWPYSPAWTPLRFLPLPTGDDVLHLFGRATLKKAVAEATGEPPPGPVPAKSILPSRPK
jgi:CubicO group peptidase (beta-lactamase class C family)